MGNMFGEWEFRFDKIKGPINGKIRTIVINTKKYSSHEPLAVMH